MMTQGLQHPVDGDAALDPSHDPMSGTQQAVTTDPAAFQPSSYLADEQLVALHEVAKALATERNLHRALAVIAEKARQLTSCASTAVTLLDTARANLDFIAVAGRGSVEMIGQRVRVADALPGQTAISGEPLLAFSPSMAPTPQSQSPAGQASIDDPDQSARYSEDDSFASSAGVRSAAIVPIFLDGKSVGSLAAINHKDGQSFGGSDLLVLHILASVAASVLQSEALRDRNSQTERERDILFDAAKQTSSSLDVQQILDGVMLTIGKSINSFAGAIFLLNDERTHLFIASERGLTEDELEIQLSAEDRLASSAFAGLGGTPFIISNGATDFRHEVILPEERVKPASLLVSPLVSRDNPMGLIVLFSIHPNAFTDDDLRLVSAVAAQTAIALENAWLYEDATRRAEEATAIYELSQSVNTNLNLHRVLNFVADSIISLLHVDKFALFLHNPRTNQLEIKVSRNLRHEMVERTKCDPERGGIAGWVYQFETPTAIQNVALDNRNKSCPIDQENVASLVSVPLQAGDEVIGVIHAMSTRSRLFTVAEMELLYTIANQVGVAIRNTQTIEHLRQKSVELRRASKLVSKALGASLDSPGAAQTIVGLAAEIVGAERCLLYSNDRGNINLLAAHGLRIASPSISQGELETTAAWIARRGKSIVRSKETPERQIIVPSEYISLLGRSGTYIGIPLKIGNDVVGVLEAYMREARTITSDELRHFRAFGGQATVALQNAMLVERATRLQTDLKSVAKIAAELNNNHLTNEHVSNSLSYLGQALSADSVAIKGTDFGCTWKNIDSENVEDATGPLLMANITTLENQVAGQLCLRRKPGGEPFGESDRHVTQTVADMFGNRFRS